MEGFNLRLLLHAHVSLLLISAEHDLTLVAGMIKYVASAYFDKKLAGVTECRSDTMTTFTDQKEFLNYDPGNPCTYPDILGSIK